METKHPVEGYIGNEFPVICNNFRVMVARIRKRFLTFLLKFSQKFLLLLEKRPLTIIFSKFCSKSFHHETDQRVVFKFHEV